MASPNASNPRQQNRTTANTTTQPKYTCTFEGCNTSYAISSEWKAHEQQNHAQIELWKCPFGPCTHKSFRLESYTIHVTTAHLVTDESRVVGMATAGHVHEGSFWCGFCCKVMSPAEEKWAHVGKHFESGVTAKYEFL